MPGPVSDSYDPEFGTGANASDVSHAIGKIVGRIEAEIGSELKSIVSVVHGLSGERIPFELTEREMRIIRFSLNRALETI